MKALQNPNPVTIYTATLRHISGDYDLYNTTQRTLPFFSPRQRLNSALKTKKYGGQTDNFQT
jgi:hypothetical protein